MPASRIGVAIAITDELRRAREDLERHDRNVALRRIAADPDWRAEELDLIHDLHDLVNAPGRFK